MSLTRKTPLQRSRIKRVNAKRKVREFRRAFGGQDRIEWMRRQPCLGCGIVGYSVSALIVGLIQEIYFSRVAFAATTACEAKRMEARRMAFSANVVCVPIQLATRNDTTTVNLNTKP